MTPAFFADIAANPANRAILGRWQRLGLPDAWLVAGCLFQTVWNLRSSRPPAQNIKDYDIFYFDSADLSRRGEEQAQQQVDVVLSDLGVTVEVANQARVHLWYPEFFGHPYPPLASAEDGIARFLVRETCVGVRPGACHAPYGLEGMYAALQAQVGNHLRHHCIVTVVTDAHLHFVLEVDALDLFQKAMHEVLARLLSIAHDIQPSVFLGLDP